MGHGLGKTCFSNFLETVGFRVEVGNTFIKMLENLRYGLVEKRGSVQTADCHPPPQTHVHVCMCAHRPTDGDTVSIS